jgi:hypothetical protein
MFRRGLGKEKGDGLAFAVALPVGFCYFVLFERYRKGLRDLLSNLNGRMSRKKVPDGISGGSDFFGF